MDKGTSVPPFPKKPTMPTNINLPLNEQMLSTAALIETDPMVHTQLFGGNESQRSQILKQVSINYYSVVTTQLRNFLNNHKEHQKQPSLIDRLQHFFKIKRLPPAEETALHISDIYPLFNLGQFLQSPWLAAMYTAFPKNPATKLLVEIAFNLAKLDGTSALDKLFNRHIQKETYRNHYDDLSYSSVDDILHILKTHVLWDNYLVPVKVLTEKRNDPDSLWHKDGLYNPYFTDYNNQTATKNYLFIPPAIYQRIIQHSDTTRQINDYQEAYTKTQEDAGSLLGQLTLLGKRFASNDAHTGIGKSDQAGIGAAIAFIQFYNDFYEHISVTQKATIPEELHNEIELIKNFLSQTKYSLALISHLPNNNPQNAKPKTIYLAENGRYILKNMTNIVVEGRLNTRKISLENLNEKLHNNELLNNILTFLAQNGGHTPMPEQINTDQISTCIGTRGANLRRLTALHLTILSTIVLDPQYQTSCISAAASTLNQALTEFEASLSNKNYQGNDALIITPDLLNILNINIIFDSYAKLSLLDPLTTDECNLLFTQKPVLLYQIEELLKSRQIDDWNNALSIEKLVWLITGMPIAPLTALLAHLKNPPHYFTFSEQKNILALVITLTPEKLEIVCKNCINWNSVSYDNLSFICSNLTAEQNTVFNKYILINKIRSFNDLTEFSSQKNKLELLELKNLLTHNPLHFMTKNALAQWSSSIKTQMTIPFNNDKFLQNIINCILCLPNNLQKMTVNNEPNIINYYDSLLSHVFHNHTILPSAELMTELTQQLGQSDDFIKMQACKSDTLTSNFYKLWSPAEHTENKIKKIYAHIHEFFQKSINKPVSPDEFNIMMRYNYIVYHYGIYPSYAQPHELAKIVQELGSSEKLLTQIQNVTQNTYFTNLIRAEIKKRQAIDFRTSLLNSLNLPYALMYLEKSYLLLKRILAYMNFFLFSIICKPYISEAMPGLLPYIIIAAFHNAIVTALLLNYISALYTIALKTDWQIPHPYEIPTFYYEHILIPLSNEEDKLDPASYNISDIAATSIDYIPIIGIFDYVPRINLF